MTSVGVGLTRRSSKSRRETGTSKRCRSEGYLPESYSRPWAEERETPFEALRGYGSHVVTTRGSVDHRKETFLHIQLPLDPTKFETRLRTKVKRTSLQSSPRKDQARTTDRDTLDTGAKDPPVW